MIYPHIYFQDPLELDGDFEDEFAELRKSPGKVIHSINLDFIAQFFKLLILCNYTTVLHKFTVTRIKQGKLFFPVWETKRNCGFMEVDLSIFKHEQHVCYPS